MSDRRLSVEFLSIPGAGKSAVSSRVVPILRERGFMVNDLSYRLARPNSRFIRTLRKSVHVTVEILLHPLGALRASRAIATVLHRSPRLVGKMTFHWLLVSALARRARRPGVHVYDQGIFQCFWSIGLRGGPDAVGEIAKRLWGSIPAPNLVVVIKATQPAILDRLKQRGERKSRIDHLFASQPQVLEHCARLLESTTTTLETIRACDASVGAIVLLCETDDDLDRESRRLAALIESLLVQRVSERATLVPGRP